MNFEERAEEIERLTADWALLAGRVELLVAGWEEQVVGVEQGSAQGSSERGHHRHAATEHVAAEEAVEQDATTDRFSRWRVQLRDACCANCDN